MSVEVNGFCDEKFASVREMFASSLDEEQDIGASFALTLDGEMVIDIWGGHLDARLSASFVMNKMFEGSLGDPAPTTGCKLSISV